MRFVGEPSCHRLGSVCPESGFPVGLPPDAIYVRLDGVGDGTREAPFGTLGDAVDAAVDGQTIAFSPDRFPPSNVIIDKALHLRGSCLRTELDGILTVISDNTSISNLSVLNGSVAISLMGAGALVQDVSVQGSLSIGNDADALVRRVEVTSDEVSALTTAGSAVFEQVHVNALEIGFNAGSNAVMATDLSIYTLPERPDTAGPVLVLTNGELRVQGLVIEGERSPTVLVAGGSLELQDAVLRGPPESVLTRGAGILVFDLAALRLQRVTIDRARVLGVAVSGGAQVWARDLSIRDVYLGSDVARGYGLELSTGASADLARFWLEGATTIGMVISSPGTHIDLQDAQIRQTRSNSDGTFGRGLQVQIGATMTGNRIVVEDNHELSVVTVGEGSTLDLTDAVIARTLARPCAADGCPAAGIGLGAYNAGSGRLTRFLIRDNALAGVQVAFGGQVDLMDGEITGNTVGVNLQEEGYDLSRLTRSVRYSDNGVQLDSSELFVPEPAVP